LFLIKKMMSIYGWGIEESGVPGEGARFVMTIPKTSTSGKENFRFDQPSVEGVTLQVLPQQFSNETLVEAKK